MNIVDKEKLTKDLKNTAEDIQEKLDDFKNKAKETRHRRKKYIQSNPEKSMLISAGIGAAMGLVLAMMMRKKK